MKEITQTKNINEHRIALTLHDAGSKRVLIFCHGFRSTSIGPNRSFVTTARQLTQKGISAVRFDQYGSGNSEGDFFDSSFLDWIKTTKTIVESYLDQGYQVGLLGHSMGGSAVLAVGAQIPDLRAIVAWCPDPNVDEFVMPEHHIIEEGGQLVQARFWQEAHDAQVASQLSSIKKSTYIVQCTADEYVDLENRNAIASNAQQNHKVEDFAGYMHSKWTFEQANNIVTKSIDFLAECFITTN